MKHLYRTSILLLLSAFSFTTLSKGMDCIHYLSMDPKDQKEFKIKLELNELITYEPLKTNLTMQNQPATHVQQNPAEDQQLPDDQQPSEFTEEYLRDNIGEVTQTADHKNKDGKIDGINERVEVARVVKVEDKRIQAMIDFVHRHGGEVRQIAGRTRYNDGRIEWFREWPSLWVNYTDKNLTSYLKPVIAIDFTRPRALSAFAHEMVHFKSYLKFVNQFMKDGTFVKFYNELIQQGLAHKEATEQAKVKIVELANNAMFDPDFVVEDEHRAIGREIMMERRFNNHRFNRAWEKTRPNTFWQEGYVNRVTYPEFQGIRRLLKMDDATMPANELLRLENYIIYMVEKALKTRRKALDYLKADDSLVPYWTNSSAVDLLLLPFGGDRLEQDTTLEEFEIRVYNMCLKYLNDPKFKQASMDDIAVCGQDPAVKWAAKRAAAAKAK